MGTRDDFRKLLGISDTHNDILRGIADVLKTMNTRLNLLEEHMLKDLEATSCRLDKLTALTAAINACSGFTDEGWYEKLAAELEARGWSHAVQ